MSTSNTSTTRITRFARAQERITAAFALADPLDPPVMIWPFHYIACGCDPARLPDDLFESAASMTAFQTRFCEEHLQAVDDDFQPYLTPYLGTGVLASAFGCRMHFAPWRDPSVAEPCVERRRMWPNSRCPTRQRSG